jgi:hypothetical protein
MRKQLFLFLIRIIRLLGKERDFIPQLRTQRVVRPRRLYSHFGRIVLSVSNPDPVRLHYYRRKYDGEAWTEICKAEYENIVGLQSAGKLLDVSVRFEQTGQKCQFCVMNIQGIPCHCAFPGGDRTGYFKLIHQDKQYADDITL